MSRASVTLEIKVVDRASVAIERTSWRLYFVARRMGLFFKRPDEG